MRGLITVKLSFIGDNDLYLTLYSHTQWVSFSSSGTGSPLKEIHPAVGISRVHVSCKIGEALFS